VQSRGYESHLALVIVILSDAKNLADTDALDIVQTPRVHDRDEILRFAQNDRGEVALIYPAIQLAKCSVVSSKCV
jgi:hypothetical protein